MQQVTIPRLDVMPDGRVNIPLGKTRIIECAKMEDADQTADQIAEDMRELLHRLALLISIRRPKDRGRPLIVDLSAPDNILRLG